MTEVYVNTNTVLHHVEAGSGSEAILFLHGFLGSGRNLSGLTRRFSDDPAVRTVQVDLPGHGRSPPLPDRPSLEHLSLEVARLADHLGADRFRVVGHSLGGRVGLALLGAAPERVSRVDVLDITPGPIHHLGVGDVLNLLLAAPDHVPDRSVLQTFFRESGLTAALTDWLLMNLERGESGFRWRIDRRALAALHQEHGTVDLWPTVHAHRDRIRVLRGSESEYLSDEDVNRLERLGIAVTTILGAGHFLHADQPEATFRALR